MEVVLEKSSAARFNTSHYQSAAWNRPLDKYSSYQCDQSHWMFNHYNYKFRKAFRESVANPKFKLDKIIGNGAFGLIYSGSCLKTRKEVAIKIELQSQREANSLLTEFKIL